MGRLLDLKRFGFITLWRQTHADLEAIPVLAMEDSFERHASLRHFLHRCVTKGVLTDSEVELLVQFKLVGNTGEELAALNKQKKNKMNEKP